MKYVGLIILLVTSMSLFSQNSQRTIVTEFGKIKVHLKEASSLASASEDLMYYYIDANELVITQGAFLGSLLHGEALFYNKNGVLSAKGHFKGGLKQGKWTHWNEDGEITEIISWKKGVKFGKYKKIHYNGDIEEGAWKNNLMHGLWIHSKNGEIVSEEAYKNGKVVQPKKKFEVKFFKEKKDSAAEEDKPETKSDTGKKEK